MKRDASLLATFVFGVLTPCLLGLGCEEPGPVGEIREHLADVGRPDIVLIVIDTLRADWTSPYGELADPTPELNRWANEGIVFEQARAQSSWTKISMASMMTSLWPRSHAIRSPGDGLADGAFTLAELLADSGYRTYGVQTNGWLHQSFGFHQGFEKYVFPGGKNAANLPKSSVWPHADRVVAEADRLIEAHETESRGDPFFLYLHFMDVHEYAAPNEFKTFGSGDRAEYLAAESWVDDALSRVREKLEDTGRLDRAILVVASDHGETFGEHGVYGHARNVLTPVLWVPLVVRLPFAIEPIRVKAQVRNLDIAPTLAELAGLPIPSEFEGESLLPLIVEHVDGPDAPGEDRPSFAALGFQIFPDSLVQESFMEGRWTYARNVAADPNETEYLFDRDVDPAENVNLSTMEATENARLREVFDAYRSGGEVVGVRNGDVRIAPDIAERLRAMGYLR